MAFRDWLRNQQEQSEKRKRLFEGRTSLVPASQAWGGYQDRPGGQRLMTRQTTPRGRPVPHPPASVTLTEKNDGTRTKVTKWEPEKSQVKVSGIADPAAISPGQLNPLHWGRQNPNVPGSMSRDPSWAGVPRARAAPQPRVVQPQHIPAMRGDIGATQSVGVPALQRPRGMADVSNQRAMYHALRRPNPQVTPSTLSIPQQTQRNIWGSRFVPNPAPMIRKERNAPPMIGKERMDEEQWRFILDRIYGGNY